jgi:hypothetical protein
MHDCAKTQEQLVDLLLGELDPAEARLVAAEAEACADCRREHAALAETLRAFDRASDAALPEESFWAGYHERLREKITAEATGGGGTNVLMFRLPGTRFRFTPMQAAAALLIIGLVGGGLWVALRSGGSSPSIIKVIDPLPETAGTQAPPRKEETRPMPERIPQEAPTPIPVKTPPTRKNSPATPKPHRRAPEGITPETTRPTELPLLAVGLPTPAFAPDTVSHFEKAQFVLRTLRNSTDAEVAETIAYERQRSRGLLTHNIVLRREAERSGNVPLSNVLNQLEPLLIDIANLPDKPSKEEVQAIRERMRRKEIIATLQTYSRLNDTPNPSSIGQ